MPNKEAARDEKKSQKKNTILAAVLSFIIPGLGHFYLRLWKPGIQLLGTYFILVFLNLLAPDTPPLFYIGVSFISIYSAVHAFKQAKKLNAGISSKPSAAPKSKKTKIIFAVSIFFVILVGSVFYTLSNAPDTAILGENVQLFRIVFNDKSSPNGYVNVPFLKDSTKYEFINIVIDFNKDGKFERYSLSNGYQEEWVVQNMAVKTLKDQPNSFSVVMPDHDIDGRQDFETRVILSQKPLEDWNNWNTADAFHTLKIVEVQKEDAGKYYKPDPEGVRIGGLPDVFRGDVPDINQGENECVPTSVANSLMWLADHYGFADRIPGSGDIINELKKDFNWNQYGVDMVNYLPGIKKFAEDHNLPIQSYQVGQNYDTNIVTKMADELNKGNLVQMVMEYREYDNAGNPLKVGGHMVTVVGASDTENGQYLYINDPLSQIPGVDVYKVEGNKVISYRFQGNAQTFISAAVAAASTVPAVKPIDSSKAPEKSPQEPAQAPAPTQAKPSEKLVSPLPVSPSVQPPVKESEKDEVSLNIDSVSCKLVRTTQESISGGDAQIITYHFELDVYGTASGPVDTYLGLFKNVIYDFDPYGPSKGPAPSIDGKPQKISGSSWNTYDYEDQGGLLDSLQRAAGEDASVNWHYWQEVTRERLSFDSPLGDGPPIEIIAYLGLSRLEDSPDYNEDAYGTLLERTVTVHCRP